MKDELDREKYPRMPWHDVHCALWGPPCRDVARHFVQRWNYAKVGSVYPFILLVFKRYIDMFFFTWTQGFKIDLHVII